VAAWAAAPYPGRYTAAACENGCRGSPGRPRWPARREQRWQGSSALFLHQFDVPATGVFQQLAGRRLRILWIIALDHNEELVMRHLREAPVLQQRMVPAREAIQEEHPQHRAKRPQQDGQLEARHEGIERAA